MNNKLDTCKNLKEEILGILDEYTKKLIEFSITPSISFLAEKEELIKQLLDTKEKYEDECRYTKSLNNEKEKLCSFLEEDKKGYENEMRLINERKPFLQEQELVLQTTKDELKKLNDRLHLLNLKLEKKEEEEKIWKEKVAKQADNFRKYLGIDIVQEVKYIIRVTFFLEEECYFLIDFKNEPKVIDLSPVCISLEDAQFYYEKLNEFHEFCKLMRKIFKNKKVV